MLEEVYVYVDICGPQEHLKLGPEAISIYQLRHFPSVYLFLSQYRCELKLLPCVGPMNSRNHVCYALEFLKLIYEWTENCSHSHPGRGT